VRALSVNGQSFQSAPSRLEREFASSTWDFRSVHMLVTRM